MSSKPGNTRKSALTLVVIAKGSQSYEGMTRSIPRRQCLIVLVRGRRMAIYWPKRGQVDNIHDTWDVTHGNEQQTLVLQPVCLVGWLSAFTSPTGRPLGWHMVREGEPACEYPSRCSRLTKQERKSIPNSRERRERCIFPLSLSRSWPETHRNWLVMTRGWGERVRDHTTAKNISFSA